MADQIRVLQYGGAISWTDELQIPDTIEWQWSGTDGFAEDQSFNVVILEEVPKEADIATLSQIAAPYTFFYTSKEVLRNQEVSALLRRKMAQYLSDEERRQFVANLSKKYWSGQYGDRIPIAQADIAQDFSGSIYFDGNAEMVLFGEFGDRMRPVISWRYNKPINQDRTLEFWPEYTASTGVEVAVRVREYQVGAVDTLLKRWDVRDVKEPIVIEDAGNGGYILIGLQAKGKGRLTVGPLHHRYSRMGAGTFLTGGVRWADANRQEFVSYFDPADMKPPLNVYFSGYRTAEGFEGYYLMKGMGAPFLLLSDPRLEGGCFYLGSQEYEAKIEETIRETMRWLGFGREELIVSGLSMGTYGAAYYAARLLPHAVILGKPLMSCGNIAADMRHHRPRDFDTSLDVLHATEGGSGAEEVQRLNARMWNRFENADFSQTQLAIAYMRQDDYDRTAYEDILMHLHGKKVLVYGKGVSGRHNDNTPAITKWFSMQFRRISQEDFGREWKS